MQRGFALVALSETRRGLGPLAMKPRDFHSYLAPTRSWAPRCPFHCPMLTSARRFICGGGGDGDERGVSDESIENTVLVHTDSLQRWPSLRENIIVRSSLNSA